MKTIHKYTLVDEKMSLKLPYGAVVLTVAEQHGVICLWAQVETDNLNVTRHFVIVGTGHEVPEGKLTFIGMAKLQDGLFIFHVFEVEK